MLESGYPAPTATHVLTRVYMLTTGQSPLRLRQLKEGPTYTMASLRPLNGAIQLRCSGAGGVDVQSSYPAPKGTPRLVSGLRAYHRSDPPGDRGN